MAVCLALLFPEALIFHALFGETYWFVGVMQTVENGVTSVLTNENMSLPALLVNAGRFYIETPKARIITLSRR